MNENTKFWLNLGTIILIVVLVGYLFISNTVSINDKITANKIQLVQTINGTTTGTEKINLINQLCNDSFPKGKDWYADLLSEQEQCKLVLLNWVR